MGWWKVQGTDNIVGDGPLGVMEGAVAEIISQYHKTWGRKPTKVERESLFRAVLSSATSEGRVTDEGIVEKVHIELR